MPNFEKKAPKQVKPKAMCRDCSGRPTERQIVIDEPLQFNIPKGVEEDKRVNPKKVFEGYKDKKSVKAVKGKKSKRGSKK